MFCPNCGKQIDDDSEFCYHCGESISDEEKKTEVFENVQSTEIEKTFEKGEGRESTFLVRKRHKTVRGLVRFSNFIGWLCVISILLLPLGLLILLNGHLVLASLETEHNTRETAAYIKEALAR